MTRLELGIRGHVQVQKRVSPFPKLKQWSKRTKDFALSMAEQFRRGLEVYRSMLATAALQQQVCHFWGGGHPPGSHMPCSGGAVRQQAAAIVAAIHVADALP